MFENCNNRADYLKKVIEYENILAPSEFIKLHSECSAGLPEIAESQLIKSTNMMNSANAEIRNFIRHTLSTNGIFYSSPTTPSNEKKLLICFCGIGNRLLVPIPVFLQCIPDQSFDVLVYRDPSQTSFLNGIPDFSNSLQDLVADTLPHVNFATYKSLVTIGTSGGGSAALYFGILANAEKAISVCGKHRSLSVGNQMKNELLDFDGYEFDRMVSHLIETSRTELILVCGEKYPNDIEGAQSLKRNLPNSKILKIKKFAAHNAFLFFLHRGKLKEFVQMLIKD